MKKAIALLVGLICSQQVLGTTFTVFGNMTCHLPYFEYKIIFYEDDNLKDDELKVVKYKTYLSPHFYRYDFEDMLDASAHFEPYMQIFHNCTDTGGYKKFYHVLGDYSVTAFHFDIKRDFCLTNFGDRAGVQRIPYEDAQHTNSTKPE